LKILAIVGTQLRHKYFLAKLLKSVRVEGVIFYKRTLVQPPKINIQYNLEDIELEKKHLENLKKKEIEYFEEEVKTISLKNIEYLTLAGLEELNSQNTIEWIKKLNFDVMIDYGSGILSDEMLDILPEYKINLHGGLSPYYKGSATLFWPFYFQQPELAGATFHMLSKNIDGGDILQHIRPKMYPDDTIHDIGCRTIVQASEAIVLLLEKLQKDRKLQSIKQKGGKLFLEKDYKPSCIKIINQLFENNLIENYLKNKKEIDKYYTFFDQIGLENDNKV
jgi:methionyl-tRNA formyltransferase